MPPSIQEIRTALTQHHNAVAAATLGLCVTSVVQWRKRLGIPSFPRHRHPGQGATEQAILAALHPPGTWLPSPTLQQLRHYDVYYAVYRLMRKGLVQRRGEPGMYEYALKEEV